MTWDALKKSINGLVNKVSPLNIVNIIPELFNENLVRGKGLLCQYKPCEINASRISLPPGTNVVADAQQVINEVPASLSQLF